MLKRVLSQFTLAQIVGLFLLLTSPVLFAPFFADDFFHLLLLHPESPLPKANDGSLFGLFSIIRNDEGYRQLLMLNGALPWWTGESFHFTFWRPFTELTHWLDYQLAAHNAAFAHFHSLLWFVAVIVLLAFLLSALGLSRELVILTSLIFALNGHHAATIAWIANRNALIAAFFGLLALYLHVLWRQNLQARYLFLALCSLLIAALSGESAVAFGGYFLAYALILDKQGAKRGFIAIMPYAALMLIWLTVYQSLGFATSGSIQYINPFSETIAFASAVAERLPVFVFASFSSLPAEIYPIAQLINPKLGSWVCLLMIAAVALLFVGLIDLIRRQKFVLFAAVAATISVIPFCSLISQDRLLLIPSIGFSLLIAVTIHQFLITKVIYGKLVRFKQAIAYTFVALHLVLAPVYLFVASYLIHQSAKDTLNLLSSAPLLEQDLENKTVVIVEGSVLHGALLKPLLFLDGKAMPKQVFLITDFGSPYQIEHIDSQSISVKREKGFVYQFEEYFRDLKNLPFNQDDFVSVGSLSIKVLELVDERRPQIIEIFFNEHHGNYIFLKETDSRYELLDWQDL